MRGEHLANELAALVEAQLDNRLTPEERQRLEELVCSSDEARAIYLEYVRDCVLISMVARDATRAGATPQAPAEGVGKNPPRATSPPAPPSVADGTSDEIGLRAEMPPAPRAPGI